MAGESGVKPHLEMKKIEVPTLAVRSLLSKGTRQVGTTGKEWVKGIPLKIQLSRGDW